MIGAMDAVATRTPLRIDLAGGTLDIWPLHLLMPEPAVTVNVALDLPSRARVEPVGSDGRIRLCSRDQEREVELLTHENQVLRDQVSDFEDEKQQLLQRIAQQQQEIDRLQRGKLNMPPSWE